MFATNANVPADGGGGRSCGGESWRANSYNGIHWVAESVAPGKDPEHVRELVGGMWAPFEEELRPLSAAGISLQEWSLTYLQGMAIDTLSCKECEVTNWLQKNACYSLLAAGVAPLCH